MYVDKRKTEQKTICLVLTGFFPAWDLESGKENHVFK